jgi:DNA-binding HxlR family transcriptional regulator
MPLGTDYALQDCAVARALEIVGDRWTLLIIRDLFYGIRRYTDLNKHIGLPPATLTARLTRLTDEGVVERIPGSGVRDEYALTDKGQGLWPVVSGLAQWGNANYVDPDRRMVYMHEACGTLLNPVGLCEHCDVVPAAGDVIIRKPSAGATDPYARALREPHRLLEPLRV